MKLVVVGEKSFRFQVAGVEYGLTQEAAEHFLALTFWLKQVVGEYFWVNYLEIFPLVNQRLEVS